MVRNVRHNILFAIIAIFYLPQAFGGWNGSMLLKNCKNDAEDYYLSESDSLSNEAKKKFLEAVLGSASCKGYLAGVFDTLDESDSSKEDINKSCIPYTVTYQKKRQVVLKYLNDHPEKLHLSAVALVIESLKVNYPCKK